MYIKLYDKKNNKQKTKKANLLNQDRQILPKESLLHKDQQVLQIINQRVLQIESLLNQQVLQIINPIVRLIL